MAVVLIATIGNRDVQVTDRSRLPEAMREVWTPARTLGEEILAHPERYSDALSFPIVAPVVRWLLDEEGVSKDELYVHLFATDQPQADTPEDEWQKDTVAYARVTKQHLIAGMPGLTAPGQQALAKKRVFVHTIATNPARYRAVHDVLTRELQAISCHVKPEDRVYLEVTGGTPAITSMMTVARSDAFGMQAQCLYKERDQATPDVIGILDRFRERQARATLRDQLELHAYTSALATFRAGPGMIVKDVDRQATVERLLIYVERRLAFDFGRARQALREAGQLAPPEMQPRISRLRREFADRDRAALLAELIHSTRIKYELGHYADFTQRLFRFQEAAFRGLAVRMGMQCSDVVGKYVDLDWVRGVPGLQAHLASRKASDGRPNPIHVDDRPLNRVSLAAIVGFFTQSDPAWSRQQMVVDDLLRLSSVSDLRNRGLAGHGFEGIGRPDLEEAFGEPPESIVPHLKRIYERIFGEPVGESPYDEANALILGLVDR